MERQPWPLRFFTIALVVMASCVSLFGPLAANVAFAQPEESPPVNGVGIPTAVTANIPETASSVYKNILTQITRALVIAFFNAAQLFVGRIAYEAANYIASGGSGQSAQFFTKDFGTHIKEVGQDALAEGIGSLSDSTFFKTVGFNLCKPNQSTLLRIQLSLGGLLPAGLNGSGTSQFEAPKPRCEFTNIVNNWDTFATSLSRADLNQVIDTSFDPNKSEIGASASILGGISLQTDNYVYLSVKERDLGRGFKDVKSIISGNVKTPASVVEESTKEEVVRKPNATQLQQTGTILTNAFKEGPIQLASYTASVFLNTLTSKFMKRIFEKGLVGAFTDTTKLTFASNPDAVVTAGKTDARNANIDLKTPNLQKVADYEVVADLGSCPATNRGPWNCTADQKLIQAIQGQGEQGSFTVREAMAPGREFLRPDWKLIHGSLTKENEDTNCYNQAYCAANLQKLRAVRILPVGFEMAANSAENFQRCHSPSGCVTLGEVVKNFFNCNAQGAGDAQHPWCHLIDPNWVITSIPQQCVLSGFGDNLLSPQINQRREECQDIKTCLQRNNLGECTGGYGYCVAEKTAYRFDAQECPAHYSSCRNYQARTGTQVSYLRNTLDYGTCSANNVGCLWYATERNASSSTLTSNVWNATLNQGNRQYFDSTLAPCSASDEGCTHVYGASVGASALNLALNPSFESVAGTSTVKTNAPLINWSPDVLYKIPQVVAGSAAVEGANALALQPKTTIKQAVRLVAQRSYVFSVYARQADQAAPFQAQIIQFTDADPTRLVNLTPLSGRDFRSSGCVQATTAEINLAPTLSTDWQRYECTFLSASGTRSGEIRLIGGANGVALIDAIQLEEGEVATDYVNGIAPDLSDVYLKLPPDELRCQGTASDHPLCGKFAQMCRQSEAGCQGYTEVNGGSAEIPAIVSQNDACPQSCVGYAEYRKQASAFDLIQDPDVTFSDPADSGAAQFIPAKAQSCQETEVGCQEFTNVEGSAQGGEKSAFLTYVQACEKPNQNNTKTYFTWEGSDTSGYQLRTWSLVLDSNPPLAPGEAGGGPKILQKRGPDRRFKQPLDCNQTSWKAGLDGDCRQFYDSDGSVFYRYFSQIVLSTVNCATYRLNKTDISDCEKTGGSFNASTGECSYQLNLAGSLTCTAAAVSCRAYAGAESGNIQHVLTQDFRVGIGAFSVGTKSAEALLVGDSSLKLDQPKNGVVETSVAVTSSEQQLFRATFWVKAPAAKANDTLVLKTADPKNPANPTVIGTVHLTPDWQRFVVGPFTGWRGVSSTLVIWSAATPVLYLDEVSIDKIPDTVFVKQNSWTTPIECDQTSAGAPAPQAMLGCRQYRARDGQSYALRQFTRLCRQAAIGCREFVDTRDSTTVGDQTFVLKDDVPLKGFGVATTIRPGARYLYALDDPAKRCQPENASCRAFGRPNLSADRLSLDAKTPFTTVYYKDDIKKYDQALCRPSELFCEEFTAAGAKEYFRNPGTHSCEYRATVALTSANSKIPNLPDGVYSGWFETGTTIPCYPLRLESGQAFQVAHNADPDYAGWGATCPREMGECTEMRDPNDTTDPLHRTGKPYFFIYDKEKFDSSSCNGNVDVGNGCILLNNLSNASLDYNISASYQKYASNLYAATAPVNCATDPTNPLCATRLCTGQEAYRSLDQNGGEVSSSLNPDWTGSECTADADCNTQTTSSVQLINGAVLSEYTTTGACSKPSFRKNDTNLLVKVKIDRDCTQWLGCKSAETVFDPTTNKYKDICTNLALCDQVSATPGDIFCAHYVNRVSTSSEPILTRGTFFDQARYVSRKVGLGQKDYSGFAIPNAFQIPDLATVKVGAADGGIGQFGNNKYRFALDYRLAATAPIFFESNPNRPGQFRPSGSSGPDRARVLDKVGDLIGATYPNLNLCQHTGTGQYGYYVAADFKASTESTGKTIFCYLPVQPNSANFDFFKLADVFTSSTHPEQDAILKQAFPPAECRAHPEADAPFSESFVTSWDMTKNPPQPLTRLADYANANTCEFGEDCECAYQRVSYQDAGVIKFYGPNSSHVLPGICQGGPRAGQSCLPSTVFTVPAAAKKLIEGSNASQTCGPPELGGKCVAFTKLEVVHGVFGQCLERDWTRIVGNDPSQHPCLVWQPTPILFGQKDSTHYQPTAGYMPPENSGQYYCLSTDTPQGQASQPTIPLTFGTFVGDEQSDPKVAFAGSITKFSYDDDYLSSGFGTDDHPVNGGDTGAFLSGGSPRQSSTGNQCEDADGGQSGGGQDVDNSVVGIVQSGNSPYAYSEAFYQLTTNAQATYGDISKIGYIGVSPIDNPNGKGRLGCGYQEDWVDGLGSVDYSSEDSVQSKDTEWRSKFLEDFTPAISRGSEKVLQSEDGQKTLAMPCISDPNKLCFIKYWETGYHNEGQKQFTAIENPNDPDKPTPFDSIRTQPKSESCESDKPYFGIRAVFEQVATDAGGVLVGQQGMVGRDPNGLGANWNLEGFWVSTCGGAQAHLHYIYMNMSIHTARVCNQIAEVRSSASRQDAAFTDRVWKLGNFSVPLLGYQYGTRFSPFSSALNTGTPGKDPLFQIGGAIAGFSPLRPPTFLGSGLGTYWVTNGFNLPSLSGAGGTWGALSNLFARIYKVYTWSEKGGAGYTATSTCRGSNSEFCGLTAYDLANQPQASLEPNTSPLPTDVTMGHYTPLFLGYRSPVPAENTPARYNWISYYTPRPPRVAAPDIRSCTAPGQCAIARLDTFSFDGQSDGVVDVAGGLHKASIRFYGWASHEQMPLRSVVVDWGDASRQSLEDARLKNRKPICATQSECSDPVRGAGITCNTNADCPPGAGSCLPMGNCNRRPNVVCHTDADCTQGQQKDSCNIRTFFGNSTEACEPNYFEFAHTYQCGGKGNLPDCSFAWNGAQIEGRCAREPNKGCSLTGPQVGPGCSAGDTCVASGLAPMGGCWDTKSGSCRYTPRIYLEDNWGWCTGECRKDFQSGNFTDNAKTSVLHPYGGCYAWRQMGSTGLTEFNNGGEVAASECKLDTLNYLGSQTNQLRPWIVYQGSLQLRSNGDFSGVTEQSLDTANTPPPAPDCSLVPPKNGQCPKPCTFDGGTCRSCKDIKPVNGKCPATCQFFDNACVDILN